MSDQRTLNPPETDLPDWLQDIAGETPHDSAEPAPQRISLFTITSVLLIVGLLGVIGYALYQRSQSTPTEGPAPEFSITTFEGEQMTLKGLRGKAVVVNFWASYCEPCKEEAPMLEQVWRDYKDRGVVFIGINTDDIEGDALAYLDQYDITYYNAPDTGGHIEDDYRITGIPETFIINTKGEIIRHFLAQPAETDLRDEIDRALSSS